MNRMFCLVMLCASPMIAAPPIDYQKQADAAKWIPLDQGDDFRRCLAHELNDYQVDVTRKKSGHWSATIRVSADGKEICAWDGHLDSVFFARDRTLYYADFGPMSSGCAIVAVDLATGKRLWKSQLKGLGPISHSKYRNLVRLHSVDDNAFAIYGEESAGRYVEFIEYKTGKTVGHKVYPEKK